MTGEFARQELRFAGSGGQGVILASIILADAAVREGRFAVQSQSYGPEARGGMCRAEVIVDCEPIDFSKVTKASFLLALTQKSLDKYSHETGPGCVIVADASLTAPDGVQGIRFVPILHTAHEVMKKPIASNIVALGAVNALLKLVSHDTLEAAVLSYIPKGAEAVNREALRRGEELIGG